MFEFENWTSINSVTHSWLSNLGNKNFSYSDEWVIRNSLECLDKIGLKVGLRHGVALIPVHNGTAQLPLDFKYVDMMLYSDRKIPMQEKQVVSIVDAAFKDADCKILGNCDDQKVLKAEVESANYMKETTVWYDHSKDYNLAVANNEVMRQHFLPLRKGAGTFDDIRFHIKDCINLQGVTTAGGTNSYHHYNIRDGFVKTSFTTGQLLLAYWRYEMDDEGYPLIPNETRILLCIESYLNERKAFMEYEVERTPANANFWQAMVQLRTSALRDAISFVKNTFSKDDYEIIAQQRTKLFPQDRYAEMFREPINPNYDRPRYTLYTRDTYLDGSTNFF